MGDADAPGLEAPPARAPGVAAAAAAVMEIPLTTPLLPREQPCHQGAAKAHHRRLIAAL